MSILPAVAFSLLAFLQGSQTGAAAADARLTTSIVLTPVAPVPSETYVEIEVRGGSNVERVRASLPGTAQVAVPAGVTYIRVVSDAFWSAPQAFGVSRDGQSFALDVHPAGVLTGTAAPVDGQRVLPSVTAVFVSRDRESRWSRSTTTPCDVDGLRWSCVVPAGEHDIRLRVAGYVSAYFWNTAIPAGRRVDTGTVVLRRGASLVGTVNVEGSPRSARPAILLEPSKRDGLESPLDQVRHDAVYADERGFFHLDGIAPGRYTITAALRGYAPARADVDIVAGRESELLAPLTLEKPRTLEVAISPPLDPDGKRWHVRLMSDGDGFYPTATESSADDEGRWTWRGPRGDYRIEVQSAEGATWKQESIAIGTDPSRVDLSIEPHRVHGIVRLAKKPLRAKLSFNGRHGPQAESGQDGTFSAVVPFSADRTWRVLVTSEAAGVRREVSAHASEDGEVQIDLPAARVSGLVVDEQGNGVENAIVSITGHSNVNRLWIQVESGPGGLFEIAALDAGPHRITAEARERQSEPVSVVLEDDEDRRVELVLHRTSYLRGVVTSPFGPVSGAEIYVEPLQGTMTNYFVYADAAGEFYRAMPPGTTSFDVSVSAPGFARTFLRLAHRRDRTLNLRLNSAGGTIVIDVPRALHVPTTNWTYLVRGEARVMLAMAERWGLEQPSPDRERMILEVPQMEPGAYALCTTRAGGAPNAGPLDPSRCVGGVLAPYGRLTLRLSF